MSAHFQRTTWCYIPEDRTLENKATYRYLTDIAGCNILLGSVQFPSTLCFLESVFCHKRHSVLSQTSWHIHKCLHRKYISSFKGQENVASI
jgi:hypothetical protein